MGIYRIPDEYYFRLHHVRPRFKNDVENVLIYMAEELSRIDSAPKKEFIKSMNNAIYCYPGNANKQLKTINNWRTEISALFGFIVYKNDNYCVGKRAKELAEKQDLVEAFKIFLYNFQYPGAHIKPKAVIEQIQHGIHFKPAQYILKLLKYASELEKCSIGITKAEACHCIFNDLRVTCHNEDVSLTWNRILKNRLNNISYDCDGDIVRYAGDILDYMEIANLVKTYDSKTYYLNSLENEMIMKFCESNEWFSGYDDMLKERNATLKQVQACTNSWFDYVNRDMSSTDFSTDILTFIAQNNNDYNHLLDSAARFEQDKSITEKIITNRLNNEYETFTTKDIGDIGENLVHGHECMRLKKSERSDLIHLVQRIPTKFAVGYDISSVETDERKRFIEVKTTISSKPLNFNRIHLTKNEWNTADSTRERYFIYRLMLSKNKRTLFLIQDPVGLYKTDKIDMIPCDGADIIFDPKKIGQFEELLTWEN